MLSNICGWIGSKNDTLKEQYKPLQDVIYNNFWKASRSLQYKMDNTSLLVPEHWCTGIRLRVWGLHKIRPIIYPLCLTLFIHTLYMYLGQHIINVNINYFSDILVLALVQVNFTIWRLCNKNGWMDFGLLILHITKMFPTIGTYNGLQLS